MSEKSMSYRRLGESGLKVSTLGLGGWTTFGGTVTEKETVETIIRAAFEAGVNLFDIADVYARGESERAMGEVLRELPRHELVVTSKVYWPMSDDPNDRGLSRKHVMESVEKSLRRIGTDYLDVYFCHRYDTETPVEETLRAMDDLIGQGKVLYWGTSEWTGDQLGDVCERADRRNRQAPTVEQPQYSLLARPKVEGDVRPATTSAGMGLMAWSPLASGLLTGKYDDGLPENSRLARMDWLGERLLTPELLEKVKAFKVLADEAGCTRAQLALAWVAAQAGVSSVLMGATRLEQLEDNLGALTVELTPELSARLDAIFPPGAPIPE
jgi:voltage-dependent potassium channel beta subunit